MLCLSRRFFSFRKEKKKHQKRERIVKVAPITSTALQSTCVLVRPGLKCDRFLCFFSPFLHKEYRKKYEIQRWKLKQQGKKGEKKQKRIVRCVFTEEIRIEGEVLKTLCKKKTRPCFMSKPEEVKERNYCCLCLRVL